MDIHIKVKTLLKKGISPQQISNQLGIHREAIKRIEQVLNDGDKIANSTIHTPFFVVNPQKFGGITAIAWRQYSANGSLDIM